LCSFLYSNEHNGRQREEKHWALSFLSSMGALSVASVLSIARGFFLFLPPFATLAALLRNIKE
jgi:hypothetical protein